MSPIEFVAFTCGDRDILLRRNAKPVHEMLKCAKAMQYMCCCCRQILRLPDDVFVSEIAGNTSLHGFIGSFLRFSPKQKLPKSKSAVPSLKSTTEHTLIRVSGRLARFCLVILRRIAVLERTKRFMHQCMNSLDLDIPQLLNISRTFGSNNLDVVSQLAADVFRAKPECWNMLGHVLDEVRDMLYLTVTNALHDVNPPVHKHLELVAETISTLVCFGRVLPRCSDLYIKHGLVNIMAILFDIYIPVFIKPTDNADLYQRMQSEIVELVKRSLNACFDKIGSDGGETLSSTLSDLAMPLENMDVPPKYERSILRNALVRVLNSKSALVKLVNRARQSNAANEALLHYSEQLLQQCSESEMVFATEFETMQDVMGRASQQLEQERHQMAKRLQEIFVDFSEDYALACLDAFGFEFEVTVNSIFENKLPNHLAKVKHPGNWSHQTGQTLQETRRKEAPKSPPIDDTILEEYAKLTGRITIDEARRREEKRIQEEESVLVPDVHEIEMLRDSMVMDGYDDDEDDSFQDPDAYVPFEGDQDSDQDDDYGMPKNLNRKQVGLQQRADQQSDEDTKHSEESDNEKVQRAGDSAGGWRLSAARGQGSARRRGSARPDLKHSQSGGARRRDERNKAQRANHNRKANAMKKMQHSMLR